MKLIRKRILPLLLMALLLIAALPMQALAAEGDVGWTQYGRTGHATASGDTVSFSGHPTDPFTTLLFRPAQDGDYRTFTFHLTEAIPTGILSRAAASCSTLSRTGTRSMGMPCCSDRAM